MSELIERLSAALDSVEIEWWQIVVSIVVLVAAYPIARGVSGLVKRRFRSAPNVPVTVVSDVARGAKWLVYLIAVGISLAMLGFNVGWLSIAGILALLMGYLVLRPVIENTAASLVLTLRPAFAVGDLIEVGEDIGTVLEIGSHSTAIETNAGVRVYTPNKSMLGQTVKVYTAAPTRRTQFDIVLDGPTDIDRAVTVLTAALKNADIVATDPAPSVVASGFDGNDTRVTAYVWFESSMPSDKAALDSAVRTLNKEMTAQGIHLGLQDITVAQASPTFNLTVDEPDG